MTDILWRSQAVCLHKNKVEPEKPIKSRGNFKNINNMKFDKNLAFLRNCKEKDLDELLSILGVYSEDDEDKVQLIFDSLFRNMEKSISIYDDQDYFSYEYLVEYVKNKYYYEDNSSYDISHNELWIAKAFLQQNLNKNRSEVIDVLDIRSTDDEAFIDRAFSERNLYKTLSFLCDKAIEQSQGIKSVGGVRDCRVVLFPFIIKITGLRLSGILMPSDTKLDFLCNTEEEYLYFFQELFHFIEDEYEHTAENWEDVEQHLNHYLPLLTGVSFYSDLVKGVAEYLNIEVDNSLPTEQVEREIVRYYFTQLYGYIENNNEIIEYLSISNPQISDTEKGSKVREFIARVFTTRTTDNDDFSANTPYSDLAYDIPRLDKNINMEIVICSILVVSYLRLKNSSEDTIIEEAMQVVNDVDDNLYLEHKNSDRIAFIEDSRKPIDLTKINSKRKPIDVNQIDTLLIDGNNLCFVTDTNMFIALKAIEKLIPEIKERYPHIKLEIIFDKTNSYTTSQLQEKYDKGGNIRELQEYIKNLLNIDVIFPETAKADTFLVNEANNNDTIFILSNDRYKEYEDKDVVANRRVIRHTIGRRSITIEDLDINLNY